MTIAVMAAAADKVTLTVSNTLPQNRALEIVEADAASVLKKLGLDSQSKEIIVKDANGNELPSQITHDGKLIFQASVAAKGKSRYYVEAGTPSKYEKKVMGRLFTERGDEFGWENDRIAYRIYGHGGAVGYDLFNKKTTRLMLNHWYASEQDQEMRNVTKSLRERGFGDLADQVYNAYCYHIDHGEGMDCYTVGPTLGGGADALLNADGTLCMPKCYQKYEILDEGPLRFTVRLTYPEIEYAGSRITETRVITLDAGSHFNCVTVSYDGLSVDADLASGVVVHKQNPNAYVLNTKAGYVGYEDLGDVGTYSYINKKYHEQLASQMGRIYVGTVYPSAIKETKYAERPNGAATGHVYGVSTLKAGTSFTYYFGTAWDQNASAGITSMAEWEALLSTTAAKVKAPMKVK